MKILVTGAAGFIGAALSAVLLARGDEVAGIDNLNSYYDVSLKQARLERLNRHSGFRFIPGDISEAGEMADLFDEYRPERVVNLAAQAGVRYSMTNPHAYFDSNVRGFLNVLEGCRHTGVEHLVYASSSSVYGGNKKLPFSIEDNTDHPLTLYGVTKKANELMAHSYGHIHSLRTTGLRLFSVYGPWGRPDMALFRFTRNILEGRPIEVFNYGKHRRGFTYIDDVVEGMLRVLDCPLHSGGNAPYRVYNLGSDTSTSLAQIIETLEGILGKKAVAKLLPLQLGDIPDGLADSSELARDFGFIPCTSFESGVRSFVKWYRDYYKIPV